MYAETDFVLALVKEDDWLGEAAERLFHNYRDDLWTSRFTLVELLLVSYREGLDAERVVAHAASLVDVRGDVDSVMAAATYVEDHGFTPFDALHLVESDGDTIISSDETYDGFADRLRLDRDRSLRNP